MTADEQAAIYRLRTQFYRLEVCCIQTVAAAELTDLRRARDAMLRMYPAGHEAEITPERLVEIGGTIGHGSVWWDGWIRLLVDDCGDWRVNGMLIPSDIAPRNMGEAMQLLERCGITVKKGGDK